MAKRSGSTAASAKRSSGDLGPGARVVLFAGPEAFLRDEGTKQLIAAIEAADGPAQVVRFDGTTAAVADVLDECRSLGLLAERKVVIVDDADQLLKEEKDEEGGGKPARGGAGQRGAASYTRRELMERYASAPTESVTLILRAPGWRPGKIDALIEQSGGIVRCDELSDSRAVELIIRRAKDVCGVTLPRDAAELMVERLGPAMARLSSELEKLAAACGGGASGGGGSAGTITRELVASFVGKSREEEAWEIQRAVLGGDPGAALSTLRDLIEVSRADPVPLRWSMADLARKLHAASAALAAGANPWDASKAAKLWGRPDDERNRALLDAARRRKPGVWAALLGEAVEADWRGKTGRGDEVIALEVLTLRFARAIGGAA